MERHPEGSSAGPAAVPPPPQVLMDLSSLPNSLEDNGFYVTTPDPSDIPKDEMESLKQELEKWKERLEKAEKTKADLQLCKLSADKEYVEIEHELTELRDAQEKLDKESAMSMAVYEAELSVLNQENAELRREIEKLKQDLAECSSVLSQDGKIKKKVAEMKVEFTHLEDTEGNFPDMNTRCVFSVTARIPFKLNQNQALLTLEDEEVAQRLTKMGKHTVNLDRKTADVKVVPFTVGMGVKFELHVTISGKKINVSEIPELSIPEEWMRDKLELNFYKSVHGGGEVENVKYDKKSRTAVITFTRPGATASIVRYTKYPFYVNGRSHRLSVSPSTDVHLEKLQLFSGFSTKTILLKGIKDTEDDEESVQDMIEIHFQKPSNGGGETESIKYVSKGAAWVCFEEDAI
ncbi:N-myc-interactor [Numida meleagris]|uniref:N-myc-interactor n=1 Tax=Numida meleagris TaxID=8996 RepID=UPI000B3DB0CC|nr:N-myc-interactor [Numida meleagris]